MTFPPCLPVLAGILLFAPPSLGGETPVPNPFAESVFITARDVVRGHVYPDTGPHRVRYDGLEGEILRIRVNGVGPGAGAFASAAPSGGPPIVQGKLLPRVELRSLGGPVFDAAGDGKTRTGLTLELPFSGPVEILVSGVGGSSGGYKLKLSSRLPALLRKGGAFEPTPQGHLLFAGRQGLRVSGVVRLPAADGGGGAPLFLKLDAPASSVGLAPHLKIKGDRLRLSGAPLAITGAHRLRFTQGADVRFRLRPGKSGRRKLNLVESLWPGRWVREDTVPGATGRVFQLDANRSTANSFWRVETLTRIVTSTLVRWKVAAAGGPGARDMVLARQEAVPNVVQKAPPDGTENAPTFGFALFGFTFTEEDADVLTDEEGYQWSRDLTLAPDAPEVRVSRMNAYGHPDFQDGQLVLTIDHQPGVLRYDLFRTNPGASLPPRPQQTIVARGPNASAITWFDPFGTVLAPPRYWVRAWRSNGPSLVSAPIDPPGP